MNEPARARGPTGPAPTLDELVAHDGHEFIRLAYLTLLRREPDPGGFVAYLSRLQQGVTKRQIIEELATSPEGRAAAVRLDGMALPAALPAPDGRPEARQGESELDRLLTLRGPAFVQQAYRLMLGREVDAGGLVLYCGHLERGMSPAEVLAAIAASAEFLQRGQPPAGLDALLARQRRKLPPSRALLRGLWRRLLGRGGAPAKPPSTAAARDAVAAAGAAAGGGSATRPTPTPTPPLPPTQTVAHSAESSAPQTGVAKPANPGRAWLLTLPSFEQRPPRQ